MMPGDEDQHVAGLHDPFRASLALLFRWLDSSHLVRRHQGPLDVFNARIDVAHDG